jgi:uncharacterized protein YdeI (YjbR/CyaY-like superfamily)
VTPKFFKSQAAFRAWLEKHHADTDELLIGFYNAASGKGGLTYKQALDEALCFGWIDGVLSKLDASAYARRFTPRRARSIWSNVNVKRATELEAAGLMAPPGLAAFRARDPERTGIYAFERQRKFTPELEARLRQDAKASAFWDALPPGYRRLTESWISSAKQPATRERRLEKMMLHARRGERIPELTSPAKRPPGARK